MISIGGLSPEWLTLEKGYKPQPGKFLIVFEHVRQGLPIFRLQKDDAKAYFDSGVYVEVGSDDSYKQAYVDKLYDDQHERFKAIVKLASEKNPSVHCYHRTASDLPIGIDQIAMLSECDPDFQFHKLCK
ncbi:hypothetical protein GCM10011396_38700 [Undibacterium terreum]|uniref:Uncharacterized protein n=1 Tax=Undibacterium terreum TaxID=1224302 RepID=A0A916UTX5_9BURK|nr:hypothetical protein GCM10011396_38700 [Undibacterium terreum]